MHLKINKYIYWFPATRATTCHLQRIYFPVQECGCCYAMSLSWLKTVPHKNTQQHVTFECGLGVFALGRYDVMQLRQTHFSKRPVPWIRVWFHLEGIFLKECFTVLHAQCIYSHNNGKFVCETIYRNVTHARTHTYLTCAFSAFKTSDMYLHKQFGSLAVVVSLHLLTSFSVTSHILTQ